MAEYLFVYGTLRRTGVRSKFGLYKNMVRFKGYATYQGKLFNVSYYPAAVPSANPQHQVLGEVYELADKKAALRLLDEFEECAPFTASHVPEYVRQRQTVTLHDGKTVQAWVYVYNRPTEKLQRIWSGDFVMFSATHAVSAA